MHEVLWTPDGTRNGWPALITTDGLFRGRPVDAKTGDKSLNTIVHLPLTSRIRGS
jgi:hypothetical protein